MDDILIYMNSITNGNWIKVYNMLQTKANFTASEVMENNKKFEGRDIVSLIDTRYPEFLKGYYKPPFIVELKDNKVYFLYGKDLKEKFEIKPNAEKEYLANLKKHKLDIE